MFICWFNCTKYKCIKFCRIFEGKSTLMIFERHENLKYKFGNRHFCAEGYYVSTVGLNTAYKNTLENKKILIKLKLKLKNM